MPCKCDGMENDARNELEDRVDELTQNLCFMCGTITEKNLWKEFKNPRIKKWWKQHQKDDTERVTEAIKAYVKTHPKTTAESIANRFIKDAEKEHPVSNYHKKWFHFIASKKVAEYLVEKKRKNAIKASIQKKLTPEQIAFVRKHKV